MIYNGIVKATNNNEIQIINDNVYVRKNVKDISFDEEIEGTKIHHPMYEFEETVYTKDEYLSLLHSENKELKETLDILLGVDDE